MGFLFQKPEGTVKYYVELHMYKEGRTGKRGDKNSQMMNFKVCF